MSGGKPVSALLRLSNPHYDAANSILTLEVRVTLSHASALCSYSFQ